MAIDWDVIRALLLHAAPGAFGPPPGYSNDANLLWHKEILERFTLAEIKWMPGNDNPHFDGVVLRLTDDGEATRDIIKDDATWQEVKSRLRDRLSFSPLDEILNVARSVRRR